MIPNPPRVTVTVELDGTTISFSGRATSPLSLEALAHRAWFAWTAVEETERT
jgi:hypothetical protein